MSSAQPDLAVRLRRRVRTPRGQLELISSTLMVAVVLALVAASQRSFFERYVREKYPTVSTYAESAAQRVEESNSPANELAKERPEVIVELYQLWMASEPAAHPKLPPALASAAPLVIAERVERSLVAGNAEQRLKAVAFAESAAAAALVPSLRFGLERARKQKQAALAARLESAIAGLEALASDESR